MTDFLWKRTYEILRIMEAEGNLRRTYQIRLHPRVDLSDEDREVVRSAIEESYQREAAMRARWMDRA